MILQRHVAMSLHLSKHRGERVVFAPSTMHPTTPAKSPIELLEIVKLRTAEGRVN